MTNSEFIVFLGELAHNDMIKSGVLASLTIAQGILESGWGKSDLAITGSNLFGMKATSSWVGKVYSSQTKECFDGVNLIDVTACFKAYDSWEDSVSDHSALFTNNSRYVKVVGETDYKIACQEVKNAGYATDPSYPSKLISLIEQYKLYEYDVSNEEHQENQENQENQEKTGGEKYMSASNLISGVILSPNKSTRKGTISKIAIHCMAGNVSAKNCGDFFSKSSTGVASHYGIGSDGVIFQYVEESFRAWCTGGGKKVVNGKTGADIDHMAVTIEVSNCGGEPDWKVTDSALDSTINLVEDIARRNGLKEVTYFADGSGTLQAHRWYSAKACPGDYLMGKFPEIARVVTERLKDGGGSSVVSATPSVSTCPFTVRVTDSCLNIRKGASTSFEVCGCITDKGVYTITEECGEWGLLKSGVGWIHLGFTEKVGA